MPKTRRKLQRKKSRKKRGGEINPFMFKSTHKIQMGEMQKQIDNRDRQITKTMNEAMKLMNELSDEKHDHLKDKVHNKLNSAKEKIAKESAEKFKNDLIADLKEKAEELQQSEQNLQSCEGIKESLGQSFEDLEEKYNELEEKYNELNSDYADLDKKDDEHLDMGIMRRNVIKKLAMTVDRDSKTKELHHEIAPKICTSIDEIIDDAKEGVEKALKRAKDDEDDEDVKEAENHLDMVKNECKNLKVELEGELQNLCKYKRRECKYSHVYDDVDYDGGRKTRRRKSRKRKSKKKRRRRKRKRTNKKRRRKSRR